MTIITLIASRLYDKAMKVSQWPIAVDASPPEWTRARKSLCSFQEPIKCRPQSRYSASPVHCPHPSHRLPSTYRERILRYESYDGIRRGFGQLSKTGTHFVVGGALVMSHEDDLLPFHLRISMCCLEECCSPFFRDKGRSRRRKWPFFASSIESEEWVSRWKGGCPLYEF